MRADYAFPGFRPPIVYEARGIPTSCCVGIISAVRSRTGYHPARDVQELRAGFCGREEIILQREPSTNAANDFYQ